MELKNYQEKALYWLGRYYDRCRVLTDAGDANPTSSAFTLTTQEIYQRQGLPYSEVEQMPGIPYVCLRIPTGGGKTLVGCEAIAVAQKEYCFTSRKPGIAFMASELQAALQAHDLTRKE